jgi:hypothetical protein
VIARHPSFYAFEPVRSIEPASSPASHSPFGGPRNVAGSIEIPVIHTPIGEAGSRPSGILDVGWFVRQSGHIGRFMTMLQSHGAWIVAAAFSVSGFIHLFDPKELTSIVPHFLPFSTGLV